MEEKFEMNLFLRFIDFCKKHQRKTSHEAHLESYDPKKHHVTFSSYCTECAKENPEKKTITRVHISADEWKVLCKLDLPPTAPEN